MTLLDAPAFNAAKERHRRELFWGILGGFFALLIAFWFVSGRPVDWPWNWLAHLQGRMTVNRFLKDVEQKDLAAAYGVWIHDPNWKSHPEKSASYSFDRFEQDWSPNSPENEYGSIQSHDIAAARMSGNVLIVGVRMNGLKSKAMFLDYDPKAKTLGFSPVELYLGP